MVPEAVADVVPVDFAEEVVILDLKDLSYSFLGVVEDSQVFLDGFVPGFVDDYLVFFGATVFLDQGTNCVDCCWGD